MGAGRPSGLSSPFDDMLEQNRKRFEELSRGLAGAPAPRPGAERDRWRPTPADAGQAPPIRPTPAAAPAAPKPTAIRPTDPIRFLDDRYGKAWRYEVTERRREGDEAVVRCRLVIEDPNVTVTRSGRARIDRAGAAREVSGSADGVAFRLRTDDGSPSAAPGDLVDAAFDRAVAHALAKCVETL